MCGILGSFLNPAFDVSARLDLIRHRGPDGSGVVSIGPAVHGHVRLSLIDLTDGSAQPFKQDEGVLSFVGEVWNYREVRQELEALGRRFNTSGDTEVLAQALAEWDLDALPRLEGMFAFAWSRGDRHILGRDRYGKVPLYVSRRNDGFAWSSERKGLGREWPATAIQPGSILDMTTGRIVVWYDLPQVVIGNRALMDYLEDGVVARLNADAPLCCLISGGLDSSLILALARRHKPDVVAYTAILDDGAADLAAARRLCKENEVRLIEVRVKEPTSADLTEAARVIEISSKAQVEIAAMCIPLAKAISADGFKACLSGEAADELFGGYGNMCIKGASADDAGWRAIRIAQLQKMARGNFVRCNKAFMAAGVECRLPFMERNLVERVMAMNKLECPPGKKALKVAASGIVPEWIIKRQKDTFQGGAGMDAAAARVLADPAAFYRAEIGKLYGPSARN